MTQTEQDLVGALKNLLHHMNTILHFADGSLVDLSEVDAVEIARAAIAKAEAAHGYSTCNKKLQSEGKSYPRTCQKCKLGPCIGERQAERVEPSKPVAWSIMYNGQHCGNLFDSEFNAKTKCASMNEQWPSDKRSVVPLYATPPAAAVSEPLTEAQIQQWQGNNDVVMSVKAYKELVKLLRQVTPAAAVSEPLSTSDIVEMADVFNAGLFDYLKFARAIEAAHNIRSK